MTTIVNPGLAGGPLFDAGGRVVGIVSLGLAAVGRYSLAIPATLFARRRERLEAGEPRRVRGTARLDRLLPAVERRRVAVSGVVTGGPADAAGLQRGDLVLSVDGEPVRTLRDLYARALAPAARPGVAMQVLREESIHVVEVLAGDRYEFFK